MNWSYEIALKPDTDIAEACKKLRRVKGVARCFNVDKNVFVNLSDEKRPIEATVKAIKKLPYVDSVLNL